MSPLLTGQASTQNTELDNPVINLNLGDDFFKILQKVAKKIHRLGIKIDIFKDLEKEFLELTQITFKELLKGVDKGFKNAVIDNEPNQAMLDNLKNDAHIFSGFKSYQQLHQATRLLLDSNDKIKPFGIFLEDIRAMNSSYNSAYLKAEYNFAIASSQEAAFWADVIQDKDLYDLEFVTAGDDRVRSSHARLHGIVRPVDDPFWDKYSTPLDFGCRCTRRKRRKGEVKITDLSKIKLPGKDEIPEAFMVNTAKEGVVFPKKHPYYTENEARKASERIIKTINQTPDE